MILKPLDSMYLECYRLCRNHDNIRLWCRQVGLISVEDHKEWFDRQRKDSSIRMFHMEVDGVFVGVCGLTSIDMISRRAEFSLYISPVEQGKGYSKPGLKALLRFAFDELGLNLVWGETFDGNRALKIFKKLGFRIGGYRREFYFKDGKFIGATLVSIKKEEVLWDG